MFKIYFILNNYFYNLFSSKITSQLNKIPNDSFSGIVTPITKIQKELNINLTFPGFFNYVNILFLIVIAYFTIIYLILPLFKLGSARQGFAYISIVVGIGLLMTFAANLYYWGIPFIVTGLIQTNLGMQLITPSVNRKINETDLK